MPTALRLCEAPALDATRRSLEHQDHVVHAVFSADDPRVVTAVSDKTARVWEAVTSKPITSTLAHMERGYGALHSAAMASVVVRRAFPID